MNSTSPRKPGSRSPEPTAKQKREQDRAAKLAEYQRNVAKRKRNKTLAWGLGTLGAVVVVGVVVASIVLTPQKVTYDSANGAMEIPDVQSFTHVTQHTEDPVKYDQTPPAGGPHSSQWLTCGIYTQPVPNENAVHSMEHGAVWVTYDPAKVSDDDIAKLRAVMPSSYAILSPYEGMDTPIALSGWNHQLKIDSADDKRIKEFFTNYWRSSQVPEPGALCSPPQGGWGQYGFTDIDAK